MLFSPLLLFVFYRQSMSKADVLGCLFILAAVLLIGYSGDSEESEETLESPEAENIDSKYLIVALLFACSVGLLIGFMNLFTFWAIDDVHYPPEKIFTDG